MSTLAKQGEGGWRARDVAAAAILAVSLGVRRGAAHAVNFYRGLA